MPELDKYDCQCMAGWTGANCELKDYCINSTCRNGAVCLSNEDDYTCDCAKGWAGKFCESEKLRFLKDCISTRYLLLRFSAGNNFLDYPGNMEDELYAPHSRDRFSKKCSQANIVIPIYF